MARESYFTPATIAAVAAEMTAALERPRRHHPLDFAPPRAALLVLDLQRYFLEPESHAFVPSGPAILPGVVELVQTFQQAGRPVIATRHANTPVNAGAMSDWWRELLTPDHPLGGLIPELDCLLPHPLEKPQYDAFLATDLDERLCSLGCDQLVIAGVMTHLCCESTARGAFMRGYRVFFLIDGTAAYTRAHHEAALLNLAHGFATPVLCHEISQLI